MTRLLTVVNTARGQLDVHAAGCVDLTRNHAYRNSAGSSWNVTAASQKDVIIDIYPPGDFEDMAADGANWRDFAGDVRFKPCAGDLPEEPPATAGEADAASR